jgi:hypothetical protein
MTLAFRGLVVLVCAVTSSCLRGLRDLSARLFSRRSCRHNRCPADVEPSLLTMEDGVGESVFQMDDVPAPEHGTHRVLCICCVS